MSRPIIMLIGIGLVGAGCAVIYWPSAFISVGMMLFVDAKVGAK